ncbi:MAG: hypothetical protein GH144_02440, partial [Clostridia bacterium]|nr:hypothetical protein [Clostridia bacterium]
MIISRGITIIRIVIHSKKKSSIAENCPSALVDICLQGHIMLNMRIKELIEKASFLNADDFSALIGEVNLILEKEREEGKTGEQVIRGGLVYLPLKGRALLVGDLHGDMKSLIYILSSSGYMEERNES